MHSALKRLLKIFIKTLPTGIFGQFKILNFQKMLKQKKMAEILLLYDL